MSMSREQENFEQLRRLLSLKRYEQPPPRYFNDFSAQVIARIEAGQRADDAPVWEPSWLQRFWSALETRPVWAGALGVFICGLLVSGMVYSGSGSPTPMTIGEQAVSTQEQVNPVWGQTATAEFPSINPLVGAQQHHSLFDDMRPQSVLVSMPGR